MCNVCARHHPAACINGRNTETYHILSGRARYNDNGKEIEIGPGTTTFCGDGEVHAIENISDTEDLVFMALIINK